MADNQLGEYDHGVDYCGPNARWYTRLVPRRIWGVDVNCRCYYHDKDYEDSAVDRATADRRFRDGMRDDVKAVYGAMDPRRYAALCRVQVYYWSVRAVGWRFSRKEG